MSIKGKPQLDLTGQKFHFLTALRPGHQSTSGNFYWWFRCDCGKEIEILPQNVKKIKNGTKSCGCLLKSKHHGKSWLHRMIYDYKKHAEKLNVKYELTENEFEILVNNSCYYCGGLPKNGIDRVDPTKGYVLDNCVSCCKICNYMKRNLTKEQFLSHIEKVVAMCTVSSVA